MSNKFTKLALTSTTVLLVSSCSIDNTPTCDNEIVLSLVDQLLREQLREEFAAMAVGLSYAMLKQYVDTGSDSISDDLVKVDNDTVNTTIRIAGVRTQGTDNALQKVSCSAQVTIERPEPLDFSEQNTSLILSYFAQLSDDGSEIWVEFE